MARNQCYQNLATILKYVDLCILFIHFFLAILSRLLVILLYASSASPRLGINLLNFNAEVNHTREVNAVNFDNSETPKFPNMDVSPERSNDIPDFPKR